MQEVKTRTGLVLGVALLVCAGLAHAENTLLRQIEDAFVSIGETMRPSVVTIEVQGTGEANPQQQQMYEQFFKFFGMPMPEGNMPEMPTNASGSGFILDEQGHIVTNNHVVDGADSIVVTLLDGKKMPAELVGSDQDTDLAVIKVESETPLVAATLGDSDALKVGQFAIAVGTPRGLAGSLAFGHITALGRDDLNLPQSFRFKQLIQTDAAINFGNSGGPLCNIDGKIIGINVAIAYDADSIGFAIPINRVKNIVPRLISEGKITRGFLGVRIQDVDELVDINADMNLDDVLQSLGLPDGRGAHVFQTLPETPASKAGVRNDDIIRKVNGEVVESATDLMTRIADLAPGDTVMLEVWRHREPIELEVLLEEYAGNMELALAGQPILGLRLRPLEPPVAQRLGFENDQKGLMVIGVEDESPAAKAGIQQGDVILEIAQHEVGTVEDFRAFVDEFGEPGGSILLRVGRQGQQPVPKFVKIPEDTPTEEE